MFGFPEDWRAGIPFQILGKGPEALAETPRLGGDTLDAREREAIKTSDETRASLKSAPASNNDCRERSIKDFSPRMWMTAFQTCFQDARAAKTDGAGPSHTELIRRLKEIVRLAPRIDEMVEALDTCVSEAFGAGHSDEFERPPNMAQAAAVLRAIKAAEDIPESHVHAPEHGERHWIVDSPQPNAKPCRVDPTDALGCTCLHAGRGNICKHIIKVLKIKEPGLSDELIVSHLGDAWGSPEGTVEAMLQAMRQANKVHVPAPRPGAALTAAAVELPARSPNQVEEEPAARSSKRRRALPSRLDDFQVCPPRRVARSAPAPQPQQEEKEEEVPEEAPISEPEPHPMNPPEYDELVRALVRLRRAYSSLQAVPFKADLEQLRTWFYTYHTSADWALVQWNRAQEAASLQIQLAEELAAVAKGRITRRPLCVRS